MSEQSLPDWLDQLGSAAPAPGGGAAAALSAAQGAALIEMVANLTLGKKAYAEHQEHAEQVAARARELRHEATGLIDADAAAFTALMATYKLPKQTEPEQAARRQAMAAASVTAAGVPLQVAGVGAAVIELAEQLPGRSNPNVLSDVAVAAAAAVAAIESAAVNVEINLPGVTDQDRAAKVTGTLATHEAVAARGRLLLTEVRRELAR